MRLLWKGISKRMNQLSHPAKFTNNSPCWSTRRHRSILKCCKYLFSCQSPNFLAFENGKDAWKCVCNGTIPSSGHRKISPENMHGFLDYLPYCETNFAFGFEVILKRCCNTGIVNGCHQIRLDCCNRWSFQEMLLYSRAIKPIFMYRIMSTNKTYVSQGLKSRERHEKPWHNDYVTLLCKITVKSTIGPYFSGTITVSPSPSYPTIAWYDEIIL